MSEWGPPTCTCTGSTRTLLFEPPLVKRLDPLADVDIVGIDEAQACGPWVTTWEYAVDGEDSDLAITNTCARPIGVHVLLQFFGDDPLQMIYSQVFAGRTLRWSEVPVNILRAATNTWEVVSVRHYEGQMNTLTYFRLEPGDQLRAVSGGQAVMSRIFAAAAWH